MLLINKTSEMEYNIPIIPSMFFADVFFMNSLISKKVKYKLRILINIKSISYVNDCLFNNVKIGSAI